MEYKFKILSSVQAFHFADVLLNNGYSFRVLTEVKKYETADGDEYFDKIYTIFVTVPVESEVFHFNEY